MTARDAKVSNGPASAAGEASRRAFNAALRDVESGVAPASAAAGLQMTLKAFSALRAKALETRRPQLLRAVPLAFRDVDPDAEKAIHEDISAIVPTAAGESLWIGADEGAALERLTAIRDPNGAIAGYGDHARFDLHDYFDFPSGPDEEEEADIEGLAVADGYLWIVGSHSLKRKKPGPEHGPDEALARLTQVAREANRFLLGRIPLVAGDTPGVLALARTAPATDGGRRKRRSGALRIKPTHSALSRRLARDVHLGPFLSIPSKDNGFDVEGLGVAGDRVFLGLRGPVLRGWAVVLELQIEATKKGALRLKPIGEDGCGYLKHFVDLDGLGVRSLMIRDEDIILLAGPTMDLDGPVRLYRWRKALGGHDSAVVPRADVERVLDLPFGEGDDHAEGATVIQLAPGEPPSLVVAYDSPAHGRILKGGLGATADAFALPEGF